MMELPHRNEWNFVSMKSSIILMPTTIFVSNIKAISMCNWIRALIFNFKATREGNINLKNRQCPCDQKVAKNGVKLCVCWYKSTLNSDRLSMKITATKKKLILLHFLMYLTFLFHFTVFFAHNSLKRFASLTTDTHTLCAWRLSDVEKLLIHSVFSLLHECLKKTWHQRDFLLRCNGSQWTLW